MRVCPVCEKTFEDEAIYCTECGNKTIVYNSEPVVTLTPTPLSEKKNQTGLVILSIVLALTTTFFCYLYIQEKDNRNYYENKYLDIKGDYNDLKEETDFMDNHVRIVSTSIKDGYYHKYGCQDLDMESFRVYNIKAAENEGYDPCPKCCE